MGRFEENAFLFTSEDNQYGGMYPVLLSDALKLSNVYLLERTFTFNRKFFGKLTRLFFSTIINIKLKEIPCKIANRLLYNRYAIINELDKLSKQYSEVKVIFFNASIKRYYGLETLQKIKGRYNNVKFVLFFLDPSTMWSAKNAMQLLINDPLLFDQVYTVDGKDAEKNGFRYNPTPYSKLDVNVNENQENDIYFCGATKNRHEFIVDIAQKFLDNKVKAQWDLYYVRYNENKLMDLKRIVDVKNPKYMKPYCDIIKEVAKSNCILEMIVGDQSAEYTLRDYEAIAYGKKLLTNNKKIFEFPYYDKRYMKYFETAEDIDTEWIKNDEKVEYDLKDQAYSPLCLLQRIMEECN